MATAARPTSQALAYANEPEPGAFAVPLPRLRPEYAMASLDAPAMTVNRLPDWFVSMTSMSTKADSASALSSAETSPVRSYASAQVAIATVTSTPAAFSAPEMMLAAISAPQGGSPFAAVPLPRQRPQGTVPNSQ
jgi:hypothetical protein